MTSNLQRVTQLMGQAQGIGYQASALDRQFTTLFPGSSVGAGTSGSQAAAAKARLDAAMASLQQTMTVQAQIAENVKQDAATLTQLSAASQSSIGGLQAQQATNQLLALAAKQQLQLQTLLAAQYRSAAIEAARRGQAESDGRAATLRFLGSGQAMSLALASLALFGLGIFGPGIASGLVAGAPQLGAGAALGTAAAAAGAMAVAGGAVAGGARALAGGTLGALRAGTAIGSGASAAYRLGQETSGASSVGAGMKGVARAGAAMARDRIGSALGLSDAARSGQEAVMRAGSGGGRPAAGPAAEPGGMPAWAQRLRSEQNARHQRHAALQAVREGDHGGAGAAPDISERED